MGINVNPGRYRAVMRISHQSRYSPFMHSVRFDELVHHIRVTDDGRVFETHYDCTITGAIPVIDFDPPREWDPRYLDDYELTKEVGMLVTAEAEYTAGGVTMPIYSGTVTASFNAGMTDDEDLILDTARDRLKQSVSRRMAIDKQLVRVSDIKITGRELADYERS